ncbi:MAG TPA: outer membrane beta-barrel protein [Turneriella sp.]|nr:outer membrane beta-barrel protein [Turneriella sp.]
MKKILAIAAAMAISTAAFGANVKANKLGVNFAYDSGTSNIGVLWHVADTVALRPFVGFKNKAIDQGTTTTTMTFGLDLPIYLANFNALDLYVAPGISYNSEKTAPAIGSATTATTLDLKAMLGLQVKLADQVHLFGELGLSYSSYNDGTPAPGTTKSTTIATGRTAVGAIFYFN